MSREAMKLALEVLKINLTLLKKINPYKGQEDLLSDSLDLTNKAINALETELAKPDFWEGYVPEPVKPAQQCWKCGDMDSAFHAKCDVPACGMKEKP